LEPQPPGSLRACPGCNGIALPLHKIKLEILENSIYGEMRGLHKAAK